MNFTDRFRALSALGFKHDQAYNLSVYGQFETPYFFGGI